MPLAILLGALALASAPPAQSTTGGNVSVTFVSPVTVGQSIPGTIAITNLNTLIDGSRTNAVSGIYLTPSCGSVPVGGTTCQAAGADPGVFELVSVVGEENTGCGSRTFTVTTVDQTFGRWLLTPSHPVSLPGNGTVCRIFFTLKAVKVPTVDKDPQTAGRQTTLIAEATQTTATSLTSHTARGTTTTTVGLPPCHLDVDGDGAFDALTDGLLMLRALFGLRGDAVTESALAHGATRRTWPEIRAFLNANCGTNFGL